MHHDQSLAQLVREHPGAAPVLERHRLDYCCGGRRTLADACAAVGADPDAVLAEVVERDASSEPAEWVHLGVAELADHIEDTHHAYLHDELPRLAALVDRVLAAHGERHPELGRVRAAYDALRAELEPHLRKEERVLFPMLRRLAAEPAAAVAVPMHPAAPVRVMLAEHDRAGELLRALRTTAGDFRVPADACASWQALYAGFEQLEADTHLHIHKENARLFPEGLALWHDPA